MHGVWDRLPRTEVTRFLGPESLFSCGAEFWVCPNDGVKKRMDSLQGQLIAFGVTIAAGMVFGLLFDLYRVLRGLTHPNRFVTVITDLLFWVVTTPTLSLLILLANWGSLRFYVFVGLLMGAVLYEKIVSPLVIWTATGITRRLVGLLMGILSLVAGIVVWPVTAVRDLGYKVGGTRVARSVSGWVGTGRSRFPARFTGENKMRPRLSWGMRPSAWASAGRSRPWNLPGRQPIAVWLSRWTSPRWAGPRWGGR